MKLLNKGKTKDVYEIDQDTVRLHFKDDVTGVDGVFDPGANDVGLQIEGVGHLGLQVTQVFFNLVEDIVPTHYIAINFEANTMDVKRCVPFGQGLEVIARLKAGGSFLRRYGAYINEGDDLTGFVEFTLKDDKRNDPPINSLGLEILNIATKEQIGFLETTTLAITQRINEYLHSLGLVLHDIKYEYGLSNDEIVLMDEISAGSMRVSEDGMILDPITLSNKILENRD